MKEIIKKYQFKAGLNLEFEIQDLSNLFKKNKRIMTEPHRTQFYTILWIEKGEGTQLIDFNPVKIEDNSILFIPHDCVNTYDKNCSYQGKSIIFTDAFFCKNDQDNYFLHTSMLFSSLYNIAKIKFNPEISNLKVFMNTIETEFKLDHDRAQFQILHNMLHVFLLQAEREMRKQGFKELKPSVNLGYLIQFREMLEQNFRKEKTVGKYVLELNISEKQLNKATTIILGKTPKQIIDDRIILEAKRLLAHSTWSVKEIAYDLGYEEPTNFIKYFRKHIKSTPLEFREKN